MSELEDQNGQGHEESQSTSRSRRHRHSDGPTSPRASRRTRRRTIPRCQCAGHPCNREQYYVSNMEMGANRQVFAVCGDYRFCIGCMDNYHQTAEPGTVEFNCEPSSQVKQQLSPVEAAYCQVIATGVHHMNCPVLEY